MQKIFDKHNRNYFIVFLAIFSFILLIGLFYWINFLVKYNYIKEAFDSNSELYNHTVNTPLTTTTSCKNFCGPPARCSITGQQCTADIDCPGCQPKTTKNTKPSKSVPPNDDAGKLTFSQTPQYSSLTSDYGMKSRIITDNKLSKTPSLSVDNSWLVGFNDSKKEFDKYYKIKHMKDEPEYPSRYSLSGDFKDDGPLASNSYLT